MQNIITLILTILSALIGLAAITFSIVVAVKIFGKKDKPVKEKKQKASKTPKRAKESKAPTVKLPPAASDSKSVQTPATTIMFEDDDVISLKGVEQQVTKFNLDD